MPSRTSMMNFLRRHQKKLVLVVSVATLASFTFFGVFNPLPSQGVIDKQVAQALDGSPIMQRQLRAMITFLSLGSHEWIREDLASTGMISILADRYFDKIKDEFQVKLDKVKRSNPYVNPRYPLLKALQVWNQFIPQLPKHLKEVQEGDPSAKTFSIYCDLYLDQVAFPPELLRKILLYKQQKNGSSSPDISLQNPQNLALFGHLSFEEWFGTCFTELLGEFFVNAAIIAEEKGYKVSLEEARRSLLEIFLNALRSNPLENFSNKEITFAEANQFLHDQIQRVGVEEIEAIKIWKKVMLAYRFFNDVGQSILIDPLSYEKFSSFANETATLELYQLPAALKMKNFDLFIKLQHYLDRVTPFTGLGRAGDELPIRFLSPEEVEKKAPELVVKRYDLELRRVTQEEMANRLTLKEIWDYQISDEGWRELIARYPLLNETHPLDRESRFAILEAVHPSLRLKIDREAQSDLVKLHPEWIDEALSTVPFQKETVTLYSADRVRDPLFKTVQDRSMFNSSLEQAVIGAPFSFFTQDHQIFYQIIVLNKPERKEILTFEEALKEGVLVELSDQKLEDKEVEGEEWRASFVSLMEKAKQDIQIHGQNSFFLQKTGDPLADQWKLVKQVKEIKRSEVTTLSKSEIFSTIEGEWSLVSMLSDGDVAFFQLIKKEPPKESVEDKIFYEQHLLSADAKRLLMHQLLDRMKK